MLMPALSDPSQRQQRADGRREIETKTEEPVLFDAFRVQTGYEDNEDLLRMCKLRIRVPDQWWGDYLALLGAVRVGERREPFKAVLHLRSATGMPKVRAGLERLVMSHINDPCSIL